MLVAATTELALRAPALKDPEKPILPDVEDVRDISVHVAKGVIKTAVEEGHAQQEGIPTDEKDLDEWIRVQMWEPKYRQLIPVQRQTK